MTANMQGRLKGRKSAGITVRQAAQIMNVSERAVFMAKKLLRLRPDLEAEIMSGRMSLHEAHRIASGRPKLTNWDRLLRHWSLATEDERQWLRERG